MSDTTETPEPMFQLDPGRVEEIRLLPARLTVGLPEDPAEVRGLLDEIRTALMDLLADRDALVRANEQAGEELARWLGHI
ncbi:hypothetical protein ACFC09_15300 [Streptomyces sp. NPDC056161]|uniref:hypothetical protein n=1 Tax=Streptomyces sp. NPDC056161 TaxID=3345732 RepID=UPI0035DD15D5